MPGTDLTSRSPNRGTGSNQRPRPDWASYAQTCPGKDKWRKHGNSLFGGIPATRAEPAVRYGVYTLTMQSDGNVVLYDNKDLRCVADEHRGEVSRVSSSCKTMATWYFTTPRVMRTGIARRRVTPARSSMFSMTVISWCTGRVLPVRPRPRITRYGHRAQTSPLQLETASPAVQRSTSATQTCPDLPGPHHRPAGDTRRRHHPVLGPPHRAGLLAQWPCLKGYRGIVTVSWHMMVLRGCLRTAGCRTGSRSGCWPGFSRRELVDAAVDVAGADKRASPPGAADGVLRAGAVAVPGPELRVRAGDDEAGRRALSPAACR